TDGALALGLANILIERGWYDREFVRSWSNGPLLVRSDTNRLLRSEDLTADDDRRSLLAWDMRKKRLVRYNPAAGRYDAPEENLALHGEYAVATKDGVVSCRTVFDRYATLCKKFAPDVIAKTCGIPPEQLVQTARIIWHARPVSYYAWSGHEH